MAKQKRDNLKVYESLIDYFDQNDLGEKLSAIKPVEMEVKFTKRAFVINVKGNTAKHLLKIAHDEGISSTMLLQRWLKEKVAERSSSKGY
ncbi:MAG: hypothetical protein ACYDA4_17030 [Ignavibacteriaceae bacterium]